MSTKCTIDHANEPDDFHTFYECGDDDNIYIEIVNCKFFETRYSEYHKGIVTSMAIPGRVWNKIVRKGERKSWGGEDFDNPKTKEQRSKDYLESAEEFMLSLKSMKNKGKIDGTID
jgi:hypothetical protein